MQILTECLSNTILYQHHTPYVLIHQIELAQGNIIRFVIFSVHCITRVSLRAKSVEVFDLYY